MQIENENRIRRSIVIKNSPIYVKLHVAFRFLIFLALGIVVGGIFFRSQYVNKEMLDARMITDHFDSVFVLCETFYDGFLTVLVLSENEIRFLFLIFISGFTYFFIAFRSFL